MRERRLRLRPNQLHNDRLRQFDRHDHRVLAFGAIPNTQRALLTVAGRVYDSKNGVPAIRDLPLSETGGAIAVGTHVKDVSRFAIDSHQCDRFSSCILARDLNYSVLNLPGVGDLHVVSLGVRIDPSSNDSVPF
jgi:hypothetical protein